MTAESSDKLKGFISILPIDKGLQIEEKVWRQALSQVEADSQANILHSVISGSDEWRVHVAEIAEKVACHVHRVGDEVYEIVAGKGVLFYSRVKDGVHVLAAEEIHSLAVQAGDVFVVPCNCAHQLVNAGPDRLIILFACPDSHLGDDRFMLPDIDK